ACGVAQMLDAAAPQRSGSVAAADELGRNVRVDLVDQALREEGGVHLPATFDQHTDQVALAELIEQVRQGDTSVGRAGQLQDLGQPDPARFGRRDERVRADHARRLADAKLRVENDSQGLTYVLAV